MSQRPFDLLKDPAALEALFAPVAGQNRLGLAISGGPDSMALMALAAAWVKNHPAPPELVVYTLDHGLRSEAAMEAKNVARQAAQLGIRAQILRWDGKKPVAGLPAAARAARYRLIGEAMQKEGTDLLLTAHHANDQAETILMRLAHASGIKGLAGMRAFSTVEGISIFRPLLGLAKPELVAIAARADMEFVTDPSNSDDTYERARWRKLLPALAGEGLDARRFAQFSARQARADFALAKIAEQKFATVARFGILGEIRLDRAFLTAEPEEIALRLIQTALADAGDPALPADLGRTEELAAQLRSRGNFSAQTLRGARIAVKGKDIVFARQAGLVSAEPIALLPGARVLWDHRFEIITAPDSCPVSVTPCVGLSRAEAEKILGTTIPGLAHVLAAAPLVRSPSGEPAALGTRVFAKGLSIVLNTHARTTALD